ncbi:MAG: hypothetical protein AAFY08_09500 [Planctomycetota bacterium]
MESSAQDQLSSIVSDFERRLGDLRDAQQLLIRQLETDKLVLETQMKERNAQLEAQRAEIAADRRQVQAERAELDRVWAAVGKLNDLMSQGPVELEVNAQGQTHEATTEQDQASEPVASDSPQDAHDAEHQPAVDHDGWSVRYAA